MSLKSWRDKHYNEIIRRWKNNEATMAETVRDLTWLGVRDAWEIVSRV